MCPHLFWAFQPASAGAGQTELARGSRGVFSLLATERRRERRARGAGQATSADWLRERKGSPSRNVGSYYEKADILSHMALAQ